MRAALGSAQAAETLLEASVEAGGTDAGRDTVAVSRQLGVVLLEHVQPLGGPLYGIVRPAELVLPLPPREGARTRPGLIAAAVQPLGEPYVALVVLEVPVVALLEEPGRGLFQPRPGTSSSGCGT